MRNKIYICVIAAVFIVLFLWCPVSFLLDKTGIIKIEDMANYKDPEKLYYYDINDKTVKVTDYYPGAENNTAQNVPVPALLYMNIFNGIEKGKAMIDTVYTNYLPLYPNVIKFVNSGDSSVQGDFVMMLYNMENSKTVANTIKNTQNTPETTEQNVSEDTSGIDEPDTITTTEPVTEPPQMNFIASKIRDAGMFRVYQVRSTDGSIGFLDISMAMTHAQAAKNMLDEQANINRIAAANTDVNFFVFIGTRPQDTSYYETFMGGSEPSTKDILDDFINGITGVAGIACFDIDTFDKRMKYCFKTDHHWNALGAYEGYTEIVDMMREKIPDIGDPLPLKGLIEFPNVEYRGSGAARTGTSVYYDSFAVMDIDLPRQDPAERVTSKLDDYLNGAYDKGKVKDIYISHYENFYSRPTVITYPDNHTGRRLLILGDSYSYWVTWLIGAHFDKTFVHYTLDEQDLDYNKFIKDNGITDVLLLQYSARTLSKATSASKYLEQVITR